MDRKKALQKLRSAKREALRNSSCIQVGRLELKEAIKALEKIVGQETVEVSDLLNETNSSLVLGISGKWYECDLNLGLVGIFETIDDFEKAKKAYQEADSKTSSPENYEFWNYVITKDNINKFIDG